MVVLPPCPWHLRPGGEAEVKFYSEWIYGGEFRVESVNMCASLDNCSFWFFFLFFFCASRGSSRTRAKATTAADSHEGPRTYIRLPYGFNGTVVIGKEDSMVNKILVLNSVVRLGPPVWSCSGPLYQIVWQPVFATALTAISTTTSTTISTTVSTVPAS